MKKAFFAIGIITVLFSSFFVVDFVEAKKTFGDANTALTKVSKKAGITESSVPNIIGNLAAGVLALAGLIFFILAVYAGLVWMTAEGNEERVTKARNTLIAAVIGLVILVSAYAITNFIQTRVLNSSSGAGSTDSGSDVAGGGGSSVGLGCCLDWINTISDPAARWTTYDDCKKFGEMPSPNNTDVSCADGPKENCWTWEAESSTSMPNISTCLEKSATY